MSILDEFDNKFLISPLLLFSVGSWRVSVRPAQPTIGSLVLSLGRECTSLGELSESEGRDFIVACDKLERLLAKCFSPDKFNYLALMMVDPQLHFHVLPRYSRTVSGLGGEFEDVAWPGPPDIAKKLQVDAQDIYKKMKKAL